MAIPETQVLRPKDPAIQDENEWQEFRLSNVEVRDAKSNELVSLLQADVQTPVTVIGRLESLEKDQAHLLIQHSYSKTVPIAIANVTHFAYGQYEDGEVAIWTAGNAGWFKIKPGRAYREIYQDMFEAIKLLFFLADMHKARDVDQKGRKYGISCRELFSMYGKRPGSGLGDADDAAEVFYKNKEFLLTSMMKGKEGVAWSHTPIYLHFKEKFPAEFQAVRDKVDGKVVVVKKRRGRPRKVRSESVEETPPLYDDSTSVASSRSSQACRRDQAWIRARTIWEFMQKAHVERRVKPHELTIAGFARALTREYDFENKTDAANYIRAYAPRMVPMMQTKLRSRAIPWTQQPVYQELLTAQLPAATERRMLQMNLQPRTNLSSVTESSDDSSDADGYLLDAAMPSAQRARKGKSVLRPKSNKHSNKGAGRRRKSLAESNDTQDDDVEDPEDEDKDAMQLHTPTKRKPSPDSRANNPRKRTASHSHDILMADNDDDENPNPPTVPTTKPTKLPLRWKRDRARTHPISPPPEQTPTYIPTFTTSPLPSFAPTGAGDVWTCNHDGCSEKVYGASSAAAKALIGEHYAVFHSKQREQLELVQSEAAARPDLPVGRLIARIREMAEREGVVRGVAAGIGVGVGGGFPEMIRRGC